MLTSASDVPGAADLAARPYTKAPAPIVSVYNWGGFYIGGHVGGAWTNQEWINTADTTVFGDLSPGDGFRQRGSGAFGGGQVGYNWQASNFVFGLEGTISGLDNRGTVLNTVFGAGLDDQFSWRADWMATITGRAGIAFDNFLIYGKGGFAAASNKISLTAFGLTASDTKTHTGYTVGGGVEYGFTPNWSAKAEYLFAHYNSENYFAAALPTAETTS